MKFVYSEKIKDKIKLAYGEDSKIFKACMDGEDIKMSINCLLDITINYEDEIIAANSMLDFATLRNKAIKNKLKREIFSLYQKEILPQKLGNQTDEENSYTTAKNLGL